MGYLEDLTIALAEGMAELAETCRERHGDWVLAQQRPSGGWSGREGDADLYYSGFGARSLMLLGRLEDEPAERLANFYLTSLRQQVGVVDFVSLLLGVRVLELASGIDCLKQVDAAWRAKAIEVLETFRCHDGGYGKVPDSQASSTYQSFLTLLAYQVIEQPVPDPDRLIAFIQRQEQPSGGFLEIRVGKRAGVNPTAAAIASLRILNALEAGTCHRCGNFLLDLQTDEGGWAANSRIPLPDLLSTFTALVTLRDLGRLPDANRSLAKRYALEMERSGGGFGGFAFDPAEDVEYTFYGLGTLALLSASDTT